MRAGRQPVETAPGRSWEATIKAPATTRNSDQGKKNPRTTTNQGKPIIPGRALHDKEEIKNEGCHD